MPRIDAPADLPGIRGLMAFKQPWGDALSQLAQTLLRGDSPISQGEREVIAAYVSSRNSCNFCQWSHSATARALLSDPELLDAVVSDLDTAPVTDLFRALLTLAGAVQEFDDSATAAAIEAARELGATDEHIHDTVLIASAFCMYNRYVDSLAAITPEDPAAYAAMGEMLAQHGYVRPAAATAPTAPAAHRSAGRPRR